jgi:4-amino-4-deoxy-L-arabinose transferase-like glycosyltransferase
MIEPRTTRWRSGVALICALAFLDFVLHMLVAGNYGFFRDELYYLVAGRHLAFGYVDFPPMIAMIAAFVERIAGDSLVAIHVVPALASALVVLITGLIARELGANRFGQFLAALASLVAVTFVATGSLFSMDVLDELWWTLGAYVLVRTLRLDEPRLWLLFGTIAGLALATKLTFALFGVAVVAGVLLTPARRQFLTPWPWLGGLIALAFLLPYVLWNRANGWPTVEFWTHYGSHSGGPVSFLLNQIVAMNPLTLPLTLAGLYFYIWAPRGKPYRSVGYAFVLLYVSLTLFASKSYFLAPAYPPLFAAGALVVTASGISWVRAVRPWYAVALAVSGLLLAPVALPLLPGATFARAYGFLSGAGNSATGQPKSTLPQYLAGRFGWDTIAQTVAKVYNDLPEDERAKACIFTANYGEASALDVLGSRYGLPAVISGHNNFFLWGPDGCDGEVMILVGVRRSDVTSAFGRVNQVATVPCEYCEPLEQNLPVLIARQPRAPLASLWKRVKHFD